MTKLTKDSTIQELLDFVELINKIAKEKVNEPLAIPENCDNYFFLLEEVAEKIDSLSNVIDNKYKDEIHYDESNDGYDNEVINDHNDQPSF